MDKEELQRLAKDYGISTSIINDIYDTLHNNQEIEESDIPELLELICFDYMHLEVRSGIDEIPDKTINDAIGDEELSQEMIEDNFDLVNDLSVDLEAIIDTNVAEYLKDKHHEHDPNSLKDIYNS